MALPGLAYSLHNSVPLASFVHLFMKVASNIKVINSPIILNLLVILLFRSITDNIVTMPWQSSKPDRLSHVLRWERPGFVLKKLLKFS